MYKSPRFYIITLLLILMGSATAESTAKFPFPRSQGNPYGKSAENVNLLEVQRNFQEWLDTFYVEGVCDGTPCARIRFDDRSYTVSEGIGYGMLLMVYMDNAQNDTRSKFDRLWNYYQAFLDGNGLMHWKIEGFSYVVGTGAATDAELDVAQALMMAYKQWGDSSYLKSARNLVDLIYLNEVDQDGYLMPGDGWNSAKDPSYQSTAALRMFDSLPGQNGRWSSIVDNAYGLLIRNTSLQNSPVGLPSDWSDVDGVPIKGNAEEAGVFGYEALRTPWRMAVAYSWFGDSTARNVARKIAAFATNSNYPIAGRVGSLLDGYYLSDGSVFHSANYEPSYTAVFVGAFGIAGMVDEKYSSWVNDCYDTLATSTTGGWYYDKTLQVMFGLVMSGEFNNLWDRNLRTGITIHTPAKELDIRIKAVGKNVFIGSGAQILQKVAIMDMIGRRITELPVNGNAAIWDASAFPLGRYILRVESESGKFATIMAIR